MERKKIQNRPIADKIFEEIDNQIKHDFNIKEFNKNFHKIIKKSIEEQLK